MENQEMKMSRGLNTWRRVMKAAISLPKVKVDRTRFLVETFAPHCTTEQLRLMVTSRPQAVMPIAAIDRAAAACIASHTRKVTTASAVAGIPGGAALLGTVPADLAQYFYHVFVLAQKLAYLYGYPDLTDPDGQLSDGASNMLTVFVGITMGVAGANEILQHVTLRLAEQAVEHLPRVILTRAAMHPTLKKVASMIGIKLTEKGIADTAGKVIPLIGGLISGGLTYASFKPGAKRLMKALHDESTLLPPPVTPPPLTAGEQAVAEAGKNA